MVMVIMMDKVGKHDAASLLELRCVALRARGSCRGLRKKWGGGGDLKTNHCIMYTRRPIQPLSYLTKKKKKKFSGQLRRQQKFRVFLPLLEGV